MTTAKDELDPRSKLIIVLCVSSLAVFVQDAYMLAALTLLSVAVSSLMGCSLLSSARKMKRVLYLLLVIALLQSIFAPSGRVLVAVGSLSLITEGGLLKGGIMVLRMTIILVSAAIMTTSTSREIIQGFVQLKIPYEIAFMVSVGVRFLPLLTEEVKDTMTALQLRGIEVNKIPLRKRLKIYSYLFMPIILGTIIKSQQLSTAMEMRAFRAYPKRTSYMMLKMKPADYAVICISIAACGTALVLYYMGISLEGMI